MGKTPSQVLAERLARLRGRRGWSARQLAERLEELGYPLSRVTIAKIENRQRGVSLDDAVALAAALDVPPACLIFPVGEEEPAQLTPEVELTWWQAASWLAGRPLPEADRVFHQRAAAPLDDYVRVFEAATEAHVAGLKVEWVGEEDREAARQAYLDALEDLATCLARAEVPLKQAVEDAVASDLLAEIHRHGIQPRVRKPVEATRLMEIGRQMERARQEEE